MASEMTDKRFFGGLYNQAVSLRAAHLFTVFGGFGGGGGVDALRELGGGAPVASVGEGKLSVSFAQAGGAGKSGLESTQYGRELLGLIKSKPTMGVKGAGLQGGFFR